MGETEELKELEATSNREVLQAELADAKHRSSKHRERAQWLEGQLKLTEEKAAIWRGATPASKADRIMMMGELRATT